MLLKCFKTTCGAVALLMASLGIGTSVSAQTSNLVECDSINMPVYIVDGVEVQNIDSIETDDIVSINVVKDPAITQIFKPRLGGVLVITTKSKKYLTPVLRDYERAVKEGRENRVPGELRIR